MQRFNQKGIATFVIVGGVMIACIVIGMISDHYLGPDNALEEDMEVVIDDLLEDELHLPDGSVNIDLSPGSKES